jgi:hypothetical protein
MQKIYWNTSDRNFSGVFHVKTKCRKIRLKINIIFRIENSNSHTKSFNIQHEENFISNLKETNHRIWLKINAPRTKI